MADDVFEMDPAKIEAVTKGLEAVYAQGGRAKDQLYAMQSALETVSKVGAKTGELRIMDTEQTKAVLEATKELEKKMISLGKPLKEIVKAKQESRKLIGAELVDMHRLTREGKRRVKEELKTLQAKEKYVKIGDKSVKISDQEVQSAGKVVSAFKEKGKRVAQYAASMANVQLSLAGIIAMIIKAIDRANKIGAMSRQITEQWEKGGKTLRRIASSEIVSIETGFKKVLDTAGPYVVSLSRAGFEKRQLINLSEELMAVEFRTGQSVQEQANYIKGLISNFGLVDLEASNYLETVRQASKTIPMLSMSEATQDWAELIDKTKVYNTDLLGTLGLYNTLMRKDIAEEIGLGDTPRVVRKEIVKTVAGFSRDLEDGWKAALGRGTTAAARMIEFEDLLPPEQFERMAKFITEKTQGFAGAQRELATRKLLEQMGFAKEARKKLAEAFAEGGFDTSGLKNMMLEIKKSRDTMEAVQEKARKDRDKLINKGMKIADGLTGLMHDLQIWVNTKLLPEIYKIVKTLEKIYLFLTGGREMPSPDIAPSKGLQEVYDLISYEAAERQKLMTSVIYRRAGGGERGEGVLEGLEKVAKTAFGTYKPLEKTAQKYGGELLKHIKTPEQRLTAMSMIAQLRLTEKEMEQLADFIAEKKMKQAVRLLRKQLREGAWVQTLQDPESGYRARGSQ